MNPLNLGGIRTRGELLRQAHAAIITADRSLFSVRRALPVVGWSIGLLIMIFGQSDGDLESGGDIALFAGLGVAWWLIARLVPGKAFVGHLVAAVVVVIGGAVALPIAEDLDGSAARTTFLVVWAVVGAGFVWAFWTYLTTARRLIAETDGWRSARRDPALRGLDDSDVPLDVATVHDVRDRADFDEVVLEIRGRNQGRLFDLNTVKPVFVLMVTGIFGLVFIITSLLDTGASAWAAAAVSGFLMLAPWLWTWVDMMQAILGRQTEANQVEVESQLYALRRHHTSGAAVEPHRRPSLLGTPGGKILLVAWIVLLVVRFSRSGGLAILVAVGLVLLAATVVVVRMWLIGRQIRVYPLDGAGRSVLQSPARRVTLSLTSAGLSIADASGSATVIPTSDIVTVAPLSGISLINQRGVGIVTKDAPVVLAGYPVASDPALTALRSQLAAN